MCSHDLSIVSRPYSSLALLKIGDSCISYGISDALFIVLLKLSIYRRVGRSRGCRGGVKRRNLRSGNCISFPILPRISQRYAKSLDQRASRHRSLARISVAPVNYRFPKILLSNVRSLLGKFDMLRILADSLSIDLMVITESWLTESSLEAFNINGYHCFHRIRSRENKHHGGGVSIYLRSEFSVLSCKYPDMAELDILTVLFRHTILPRSIPFFAVIAVYFPPGTSDEIDYTHYITSEIDRLFLINPKVKIFLLGDFNDLNTCFIKRFGFFKQIIKGPTRGNRLLDLCFTNVDYVNIVNIESPILTSDHNTIIISPVDVERSKGSVSILTRPRKKSCFISMSENLQSINWSLLSLIDDINVAADLFHGYIKCLYEICFPEVRKVIRCDDNVWMNGQIAELLKKRNLAYKSKSLLIYDNLNALIKKKIKDAKSNWLISKLNHFKGGSKNYFDAIKKIVNAGSKKVGKFTNFEGLSSEESYDQICAYFKKLANTHSPLSPRSPRDNFIPDNSNLDLITELEVFNQLNSLNVNSTTAPDGVPIFILKEFSEILAFPITNLINLSISSLSFPGIWKNSYLLPIPKIMNPSNPSQMRPISISSVVPKICERHILKQMLSYLRCSLDPFQFGGVPSRSTCHYLTFYIDFVLKSLDVSHRKSVISVITDFSKAYDNVDHVYFISRVEAMNLPDRLVMWLISFLDSRVQSLIVPSSKSILSFTCSNGVPQGSVLAGLVFAVVVDEFLRSIPNRLKFVDDLTVSVAIDNNVFEPVQKVVDVIDFDSEKVKLPLNYDKCCFIMFNFGRSKPCPSLVLNGSALNRVQTVRILGLTIQENLKWDFHISKIISSANKSFYYLYNLSKISCDRSLLLKVYFLFVRPRLEYCSSIWHNAITIRQCNDIEAVQKRAVRIIMGHNYVNYSASLICLNISSLAKRREDMLFSYAMQFGRLFPDSLPKSRSSISKRNTRFGNHISLPKIRTERYRKSPLISIIKSINCGLI